MRTCTHGTCTRPHRAGGLCALHYQRQIKGRDMDAPVQARNKQPVECTFPGCDRPSKALTLCKAHWWQQSKGLPLTPIQDRFGAKPRRVPVEPSQTPSAPAVARPSAPRKAKASKLPEGWHKTTTTTKPKPVRRDERSLSDDALGPVTENPPQIDIRCLLVIKRNGQMDAEMLDCLGLSDVLEEARAKRQGQAA